jgi:hypothetical protein
LFFKDPCESSPCGHDEDCIISTAAALDTGRTYVCVKSINFCERMKPCNNRSECIYFKKNNTFYCRCLNGATSCDVDDPPPPKRTSTTTTTTSTWTTLTSTTTVGYIITVNNAPQGHKKQPSSLVSKKKHEKITEFNKGAYEIFESNGAEPAHSTTSSAFTWQFNLTTGTTTRDKDFIRVANAESKANSEIPKFGFNYENVSSLFK